MAEPIAPPAGSAVYLGQPSPQVIGGQNADPMADVRAQVAAAAARQGAEQAKSTTLHGLNEIKVYIQENPASVKVFCFMTGLVLVTFSILGLFNVFEAAFEPGEYVFNVFNVVFGFIICICDGKESWMKQCFNAQERLFTQAYFLATQTGRAMFYFYIGSMTMLTLPESWVWKIVYFAIGGVLCILALLMLFIQHCGERCGCSRGYVSESSL
eukprot:TRINITY_DN25314_c0_g1_i1.p1 TRINITY_DN25314_c0_g1~~TRINITY_DN25314_c0_g1_i1.p1  ORF type:complete len:246 (-),score=51.69 TRINITY_DN25314_c0_g1_i1:97-732(-)